MAHATIFRSAISSISFGFSKLAERELNGLDSMPLVAGDDTFRTSSGDFDDSEYSVAERNFIKYFFLFERVKFLVFTKKSLQLNYHQSACRCVFQDFLFVRSGLPSQTTSCFG